MNKVILDASALLAFINRESGANIVRNILPYSVMSTVNVTEVICNLHIKIGVPILEAQEITVNAVYEIIPFDLKTSFKASQLIEYTKAFGLSLADRACIATGILHNLPIYTADQAWSKLIKIPQINLIR